MICIHHNDADGRCAAAIVHREHPNCRFIEMEYGNPMPWSKIVTHEIVYMVDFSLPEVVFNRLLEKTSNVVWIDHHKTILDHSCNTPLIPGVRDISKSACELTWNYLFPGQDVPEAVRLIGDYDTWTLALPDSKAFRFGMDLIKHGPKDAIWDELFHPMLSSMKVAELIDKGQVCLDFVTMMGQEYGNAYGWGTEFEGHRCFAMGIYMYGSSPFGGRLDEYPVCLSYEFMGDKWIVGLYSTQGIDVSVIAKKYGGGGHTGAAGFVCEELPFKK